MRERITDKQLQAVVDRINQETDSPLEPYTTDASGKIQANIGNYHLSWAYGGVELNRMDTQGGGVTCPLGEGHGTKRELYEKMYAFLRGLEAAKNPGV